MPLYLVPTPIGNLDDMTYRAVKVLKAVDVILAEDTRTSAKLLKHYDIQTPMRSHHKFNEHKTTHNIVEQIKSGMRIAMISDAGTPAISDPGFLLVRACVDAGVDLECLPGATAFVPAIVNSGFPNERFCFEGFLPAKKGRQTRISSLLSEQRTMIFYESPYRLVKTLKQLAEVFGDEREACVCRELTKIYEEKRRGSLKVLQVYYTEHPPKGEIVLLVRGIEKVKKEK